MPVEEIRIGDVWQTKKQHPCGTNEWTVTRIGADIKIRCGGCGRIVMMDRETFLKRKKKLLVRGPEPAGTAVSGAIATAVFTDGTNAD